MDNVGGSNKGWMGWIRVGLMWVGELNKGWVGWIMGRLKRWVG